MSEQQADPKLDGICCGQGGSWAPKAEDRAPLVGGCQLCPNSPTYWARDKPADRQEARLG
jgi:hypothetical protein